MKLADSDSRITLEKITSEKDLGVYFSSDLKWTTHYQHSADRENSILGQLRQAFQAWNTQSFKAIYSAFFKLNLEYASSVWNPHRIADVKIIEKVQRRATRLVSRLRNLNYSNRLSILGLTTLEERKLASLDQIHEFNLQSRPR